MKIMKLLLTFIFFSLSIQKIKKKRTCYYNRKYGDGKITVRCPECSEKSFQIFLKND